MENIEVIHINLFLYMHPVNPFYCKLVYHCSCNASVALTQINLIRSYIYSFKHAQTLNITL